MAIVFVMVPPPGNSLKLYIDANARNLPHKSPWPPNSNLSFKGVKALHAIESRFLSANLASMYHEGGTSCMGADTYDVGPKTFFSYSDGDGDSDMDRRSHFLPKSMTI